MKRIIQVHFRENITLEDFARYSDYNYFYVSKLIKRSFGLSFSQLLTEYRIACAQELLQEKEFTISQIALQCGFGSILAVPCQGAKIIFEAILKSFAGIPYESMPTNIDE